METITVTKAWIEMCIGLLDTDGIDSKKIISDKMKKLLKEVKK